FSDIPVTLSVVTNQTLTGAPTPAAVTCPVLNLSLGPIHLNLLGLDVLTSPICLTITAIQGGGLLGDLLCSVGNLLNQGLSLNSILGALTVTELNTLLGGLTDLLNGALCNILNSII